MSTTITNGSSNFTPALVLSYEAETITGNTIHDVIGGTGEPAVTFGAETMRTGVLEMYFTTRALAWAAQVKLKATGIFTLVCTEEPNINMKFVRAGRMSIGLDSETLKSWVVKAGFQEVP